MTDPGRSMLTIASWNLNSLRVRRAQLLAYLDEHQPDVVCLQETRLRDEDFPRADFEGRGYAVVPHGSGGRAGVAIASRLPIDEQIRGIPGFEAPGRRLAIRTGLLWIDTVYTPTRTKIGKTPFLHALRADHDARLAPGQELVLAGDFNICFDERDYASASMISEPDVHPGRPEDLALRALLADRLTDCFRRRCDQSGHYSWFPYARWALRRNYGMRLDYVFATATLAERLAYCVHDRAPREAPRPSDHTPLRAGFGWEPSAAG